MIPDTPEFAPHRWGRLLLWVGLVASAACSPERHPPPPVGFVLITIDTLPADRVGAWGDPRARTPFLDRLARQGLQVRDAIAPTPITLPSHATILTGLDPPAHGVRENGFFRLTDEFRTVAERLPADVPKAAFVGALPLESRFGLAQGFDVYDEAFSRSSGGRPAERSAREVLRAAADWLRVPRAGPRPFTWVHLYDPHYPYEPPAPWAAATGAYRGEVAYTDRELGRFLRELGADGPERTATVLVVADHGESLGAHGEITHSLFVYDVTQRVPLILAGPGILPALDAAVRPLVDVAPTILSGFEVEAADLPGVALTSPAGERAAWIESMHAEILRGASSLYGLRGERWKYIEAPRPELYDVEADPRETHNVHAEHPEVAAGFASEVDRIRESARPPARASLDPETAEALRSLGYAGDAAPPAEPARDPKDLAPSIAAQWSGEQALRDGNAAAAIPHLQRAIQLDPRNKEAHAYLAAAFLARGEPARAAEYANRALELPPPTSDAPIRATLEQARQALTARDSEGP